MIKAKVTAMIGAIVFIIPTVLYFLMVLGFPVGEFGFGGKYIIMPTNLRIVCAISILIQTFAIMIVLQTGGVLPRLFSIKTTRRVCFFFALYLSINVIMNFLSGSPNEKWVMGPLSLITAISFWITSFNG